MTLTVGKYQYRELRKNEVEFSSWKVQKVQPKFIK